MKRLTERDEFRNADIVNVDSYDLQINLDHDDFNRVTEALNKLADYEDLEEQGKLLKLPCVVGTPVYYIQGNCKEIPKEMMFVERTFFRLDMISRVGTEIFLTKEEAEAILRELKR